MKLILHGRNRSALDSLADECRQLGAAVRLFAFDVRDIAEVRRWGARMASEEALDLVIANAGMNISTGPDGAGEPWEAVEALLDTNLRAVLALVNAALPAMRTRRRGQIALVSSLAAYFGLPVTPSYCASKAAVKAYAEALRGWLCAEGIAVNVIMPGYVESAMCRGRARTQAIPVDAGACGARDSAGSGEEPRAHQFSVPLEHGHLASRGVAGRAIDTPLDRSRLSWLKEMRSRCSLLRPSGYCCHSDWRA